MSLSTRSATAAQGMVQDENPRFAGKPRQTVASSTSRRAGGALSDITNVTAQANSMQVSGKPAQRQARSTASIATIPKPAPIMHSFQEEMMVDEPTDSIFMDTQEAMQIEQSWTDIDELDHQDPQAVTAYVGEIYDNCRQKEILYSVTHNYMPGQSEISEKMRYILIDWLVEVHLKFKLLPETMSLAVNLVDRFLAKHSVSRDNLQLVGITSMFLAAKYEEIYPPECNDFVYISASAYTREQILAMEGTILNAVEFNLTVPTSLHFLRRFSKAAGSDYPTHTLCKYLLELALVDMRMNKHLPSITAAAAVYLARHSIGQPEWHSTLVHYTKYTEAEVLEVAQDLLQVLRDAQSSNHQAVVRKYSSRKFGEVARRPIPQSL